MAGDPQPGHSSGALPLGGILLVGVGVLLLLQTTGVVPWRLWLELWRFWPVLLVVAGVLIFLGGRAPLVASLVVIALLAASVGGAYFLAGREVLSPVTDMVLAEPREDLRSTHVHLVFAAGDLRVQALPLGSADLVRGNLRTPGREAQAVLERGNGAGQLNLSTGATGGLGWLRGAGGAEWDLSLSRDVALTLDVDGGAANMDLDLRHLQVESLDLDVGAAEVRMTVPERGEADVRVNAGAASITVAVPEGVAARVSGRTGLASFDVDANRFPRNGDVYQSPDYDTAPHRVNLEFRVGAASVTVR